MQRILDLLRQQSLTTALRAMCTPVDRSHIDTRTFRRLCADLKATMRHEGGVGLAAPQCGERMRLFVMNVQQRANRSAMRSSQSTLAYIQKQRPTTPLEDEPQLSGEQWDERLRVEERKEQDEVKRRDYPSTNTDPVVLINPVIVSTSPQRDMGQESCLSIPKSPQHCTTLHYHSTYCPTPVTPLYHTD